MSPYLTLSYFMRVSSLKILDQSAHHRRFSTSNRRSELEWKSKEAESLRKTLSQGQWFYFSTLPTNLIGVAFALWKYVGQRYRAIAIPTLYNFSSLHRSSSVHPGQRGILRCPKLCSVEKCRGENEGMEKGWRGRSIATWHKLKEPWANKLPFYGYGRSVVRGSNEGETKARLPYGK